MKNKIITAAIAGFVLSSTLFANAVSAATYTVQQGDTLWGISVKTNMSVDGILKMNGLTSTVIFPNQVLQVGGTSANTQPPTVTQPVIVQPSNPQTPIVSTPSENAQPLSKYTVVSGDTLYGISKKLSVSFIRIIALNPQLANPNVLKVGMVLSVPSDVTPQAPTAPQAPVIPPVPQQPTPSYPPVVPLPTIPLPAPVTQPLPPRTAGWEQIADSIVNTGEQYIGTKYQYGAKFGDTSSFDCSSFVEYVYSKNGINLPRIAVDQSQIGQDVPLNQLQKGDLVFFSSSSDPIGHVAIYIGDNQILHATSSRGVMINPLNDYWMKIYVKAKRVF